MVPFGGDVDISGGGSIFYREATDVATLNEIQNILMIYDPLWDIIDLTSAFIATWIDVGYFDSHNELVSAVYR